MMRETRTGRTLRAMSSRPLVRLAAASLAAGVMLALSSCGGDDAEASAQQQVCDARADIGKQVDELKAMTPSTVTADGVSSNLQAIRDGLSKMRDARKDLSDDRRKELDQANQAFAAEIRDVGSTVLRSTSAEDAKSQVKAALDQLGGAYQQTLGKIDCS